MFEEKKQAYYEELSKHIVQISQVSQNLKEHQLLNVILSPSNDLELEYEYHFLMYVGDIQAIYETACLGILPPIDIKNSACVDYLIKVVKTSLNNESIEEITKSYDLETLAKIGYEVIVIAITNMEEIVEYVCRECGIDPENENQLAYLNIAISKTQNTVP